jgi:hypothetical protein
MNLARKAQGRIIHQSFDVTLTPPQSGELGDTDAAFDIGKGLMREAMRLLQEAATREGFKVEIEFGQAVY